MLQVIRSDPHCEFSLMDLVRRLDPMQVQYDAETQVVTVQRAAVENYLQADVGFSAAQQR